MKKYAVLYVALFLYVGLFSGDTRAQTAFDGRWFAANSPWNTPVGDATVTDYSETAVLAFLELGHLNMNEWNIYTPAVVYGDSSKDKTQDIVFKDGLGHPWTLKDVPIPQRLIDYALYRVRQNDTDGMTCLYDAAKKGFYSFWQPRYEDGEFKIRFGGFSPIDGPGWSVHATHSPVRPLDTPSLGRAAGASYCGGLIRKSEIESGHINHALAVMWPVRLVRTYRTRNFAVFPAATTDGVNKDTARAVPAGARLQLDPDLTEEDLRTLGLNDTDIIVARALQEYGGYIVDTGGLDQYIAAICFENMMTSPNHASFGATSTWPKAVYRHFRFVEPPPFVPLDNAAKVRTPIP